MQPAALHPGPGGGMMPMGMMPLGRMGGGGGMPMGGGGMAMGGGGGMVGDCTS
jgi:hypothetical protein